MPTTQSNQLELAIDAAVPRGYGIRVTRALQKHRSCRRTLEKVGYVRRFFPELDGVSLKIGLTRSSSGMAVPGGNEIWLNPFHVSNHTIAHEFVHLLQRRGTDVPQGERSCDLFSLARHWTLNDVNPSYVKVPPALLENDGTLAPRTAALVYHTAVESIRKKREGMRNYIAWFEARLRESAG